MFVPNFKILDQVVPEKSLTKISIFITLEWQIEKGKNRKRRQKLISELWFCFQWYTYLSSSFIQNLKTITHRCWADMMESFIGKKEKRTNKGTDKQYVGNSLIHDTTYHTRCLYQISKSWSCDPDAANKISFPLPKEAPHKIWLWLVKQFRRRSLSIVDDDGRRTDGRRTDAGPWVSNKLTYEPSAQVSLKRGSSQFLARPQAMCFNQGELILLDSFSW